MSTILEEPVIQAERTAATRLQASTTAMRLSFTVDLSTLGKPVIERGSHVEPDGAGRWFADLSPVNGPRLGPFDRRSAALFAERNWLNRHWLVKPT